MAPSIAQLTLELRTLIHYHLDNDLLSNALFLAERLHALEAKNPDAVHLLALCYMRNGQTKIAYDYVQGVARRSFHLGCAYVFALSCLELKRPSEAIDVLERTRQIWTGHNNWVKHDRSKQRFIPDAPAMLVLLGKLYEADRKTDQAVKCYAEALKLNPFMWDAFEKLCETGTNIRVPNIFKLRPELLQHLYTHSEISRTASVTALTQPSNKTDSNRTQNSLRPLPSQEVDPFSSASGLKRNIAVSNNNLGGFRITQPKELGTLIGISRDTTGVETPPALHATNISQHRLAELNRDHSQVEPPHAPVRRNRPGHVASVEINPDSSQPRSLSTRGGNQSVPEDVESAGQVAGQTNTQHKRTISGSMSASSTNVDPNVRRSRRLFSQIRPNSSKPPPTVTIAGEKDITETKKPKITSARGRPATVTSNVGRVVSGNRKTIPPEQRETVSKDSKTQMSKPEVRPAIEKPVLPDEICVRDLEAIRWLLEILGRLGQGYYDLSRFRCKAAIERFRAVPQAQKDTPWVLSQIGKALYEQNNYIEADKVFMRVRKLVPSSMADMEVYSTVLWHLKNDTELAFLSHELLDVQRLAPEAWCTIGNSFSLQREHDQALKCFKRATQLNPRFAYGYTLQGHEYIANEEYNKAMCAYRRAISADRRHYNGWYGLGKVYEKLGDYKMAEKHYRAAATINPTNAVLLCCIGHVLEKLKQPQAALEQYRRASNLQPTASNSLYRTARVLLNLRRNQDALRVLSALKDMAPDESNVHFMLARTYARLHNKPLAIKHYTIAMNLDPKAAPYLKEQMEGLDEEDNDDDDELDDEDEEMT